MPLLKPIKIYSGRIAQLKRPVGNNQQGRASDINPIIDWINQRSDVNTAANAVTGGTSAAVINTISGTITTPSFNTAANNSVIYTVTNSACTPNSTVLVTIAGGTNSAGVPVILRTVAGNGNFVITFRNIDNGAVALNGSLIFKFIIL